MALLSPDSRFYQAWSMAADLVIINVLTIIASVPVVTAGAALTATTRVTSEMVREEDSYVVRSWWRAFKGNFAHATAGWIPVAALGAGIFWEYWMLSTTADATLAGTLSGLLIVALASLLGTWAWFSLLVARFDNSFGKHLLNAMRLAVGKLPHTLVIVAVWAAPIVLVLFQPTTWPVVATFMAIIGIAFALYLTALIQRRTLTELM